VTKVLAAVLRVRNRPRVTVPRRREPTIVWPVAAVTVKVFAAGVDDRPVERVIDRHRQGRVQTVPVSSVAVTAAAVVEVTMPPRISAAVSVPVALSVPGVG
jgi:hypothetical protein